MVRPGVGSSSLTIGRHSQGYFSFLVLNFTESDVILKFEYQDTSVLLRLLIVQIGAGVIITRESIFIIMPQLDKCLKFMAVRGVGGLFCVEYSHFLSLRIDLNFRHLSSCDTIDFNDAAAPRIVHEDVVFVYFK